MPFQCDMSFGKGGKSLSKGRLELVRDRVKKTTVHALTSTPLELMITSRLLWC